MLAPFVRTALLAGLLLPTAAVSAPRTLGDVVLTLGADLAPQAAEGVWGEGMHTAWGDGARVWHPRMHAGARVVDQDRVEYRDADGRALRSLVSFKPVQAPDFGVERAQAEAAAAAHLVDAVVVRSEAILIPDGADYVPVWSVALERRGLPHVLWIDGAEAPAVILELPVFEDFEGTVHVYDTSELHGDVVERPVFELE